MNAEVIGRCTERELHKICRLIDQLIASWIHDDDAAEEELDKTTNKLPRCGRRQVPQDLSWDELASYSKRIMYRCQLHNRCSFTCFKGRSRAQSCRLAQPSAPSDCLRLFQLRAVLNSNGEVMMPKKDPNIVPPPHETSIPPKEKRVIICAMKKISDIDRQLVDGNISVSATLGCNSNISFISTPGSAQSALFYIGNYMKKPIDETAEILPLVYSANRKREKHPSKAEDSGSRNRNTKYLSQIILNRLHGSEEVSDQIAASALYGYDSYLSSHQFENFYPVDLFNFIKTGGKSLESEETGELNSNDYEDNHEEDSSEEKIDIGEVSSASGQGQPVGPSKCRSSGAEGGGVVIRIVRDIDD